MKGEAQVNAWRAVPVFSRCRFLIRIVCKVPKKDKRFTVPMFLVKGKEALSDYHETHKAALQHSNDDHVTGDAQINAWKEVSIVTVAPGS